MKIIDFVKALLPHFGKDRVIEDLRITIAEYENFLVPSVNMASEYLKINKIKSASIKNLSDVFYRNFDLQRSSKQPNFVSEINKRMPYLKENAEYVLEQIEALFEKDIINEGLTAKKAVLLKAASSLSFISSYGSDLLNIIYSEEEYEITKDKDRTVNKNTTKYVNVNMFKFANILSDYSIPLSDFKKIIGKIPEVVVNTKTENAIRGVYNEKEIDPFSSNRMSKFTYSPIYQIRLIVAEWQSNRYKANKDKKKVLELRLLHLKNILENKQDAKLEEEIDYIQSRIDKIDRSMREVEESLDMRD